MVAYKELFKSVFGIICEGYGRKRHQHNNDDGQLKNKIHI